MNQDDKGLGLSALESAWAGHRTLSLRLAASEQGVYKDGQSRLSDDDGLVSEGSTVQAFEAESTSTDANLSSSAADNSDLPAKAAALKAKRKRQRLRKKAANDTVGAGAERRVNFIRRSLQVAQEDFAIDETIHSNQGYEGVRDGGVDWRDSDPGVDRLDFLRNSRGYLIIDTSGHHAMDIPLADADGRIWAVILGEPTGWDTRRKGIRVARDCLDQQTAHLAVRPNRRGAFQSFNYGFSFGNGRTKPMNFINSPTIQAALTEFYEDEHMRALFQYAESAIQTWFPDHQGDFRDAIAPRFEQHCLGHMPRLHRW
ncbi:hypothetical protein M407DRAFT_23510 [Tulasnella calospora MUT 4182]|uniref:Uncharacterized protein n=1 Tax=Tulasnella calospora MUT 4182 TaxID=1051891 RepID=A0A0C3QJD9_9AGAM|nr:hypothetical protein M407DRAFT_23510 [Tulasnella calospora MUT 4182]